MKVVILAGGRGTRLSEETVVKPKPMVEIGGKPILWHIMKIYSHYGYHEFIICLGYKGFVIKEYFANYFLHMSDVTFDMKDNRMHVHHKKAEPWKVTLVDTGDATMTGGRIKRIKPYIGDEPFFLTYGDGVSNIDIPATLDYHYARKKIATVTAVKPLGRFGAIDMDQNGIVREFREKPRGDESWINGGFFVFEPGVVDYIKDDSTVFEKEPMEDLANDSQLSAYCHYEFWKPMDTLREKEELEVLWFSGKAPWKIWND